MILSINTLFHKLNETFNNEIQAQEIEDNNNLSYVKDKYDDFNSRLISFYDTAMKSISDKANDYGLNIDSKEYKKAKVTSQYDDVKLKLITFIKDKCYNRYHIRDKIAKKYIYPNNLWYWNITPIRYIIKEILEGPYYNTKDCIYVTFKSNKLKANFYMPSRGNYYTSKIIAKLSELDIKDGYISNLIEKQSNEEIPGITVAGVSVKKKCTNIFYEDLISTYAELFALLFTNIKNVDHLIDKNYLDVTEFRSRHMDIYTFAQNLASEIRNLKTSIDFDYKEFTNNDSLSKAQDIIKKTNDQEYIDKLEKDKEKYIKKIDKEFHKLKAILYSKALCDDFLKKLEEHKPLPTDSDGKLIKKINETFNNEIQAQEDNIDDAIDEIGVVNTYEDFKRLAEKILKKHGYHNEDDDPDWRYKYQYSYKNDYPNSTTIYSTKTYKVIDLYKNRRCEPNYGITYYYDKDNPKDWKIYLGHREDVEYKLKPGCTTIDIINLIEKAIYGTNSLNETFNNNIQSQKDNIDKAIDVLSDGSKFINWINPDKSKVSLRISPDIPKEELNAYKKFLKAVYETYNATDKNDSFWLDPTYNGTLITKLFNYEKTYPQKANGNIDNDFKLYDDVPLISFCYHKIFTNQYQAAQILSGMTICFTGDFKKLSYPYNFGAGTKIEDFFTKYGAKCIHTVTKNLNILITGDKPGPSKVNKAKELGILIMPIEEFMKKYNISQFDEKHFYDKKENYKLEIALFNDNNLRIPQSKLNPQLKKFKFSGIYSPAHRSKNKFDRWGKVVSSTTYWGHRNPDYKDARFMHYSAKWYFKQPDHYIETWEKDKDSWIENKYY